jgi:hypothetical protein
MKAGPDGLTRISVRASGRDDLRGLRSAGSWAGEARCTSKVWTRRGCGPELEEETKCARNAQTSTRPSLPAARRR